MLGQIYVNSCLMQTVMVSRSRSMPVSTGGSIENTGIVVSPHEYFIRQRMLHFKHSPM